MGRVLFVFAAAAVAASASIAGATHAGSISGTVTAAEDGQPLPGICVSVTYPDGYYVASTRTDAAGHYIVDVPPGQHKVYFYDCFGGDRLPEWYDDKPDLASADPVSVQTGVDTPGINAALVRGGAISGTITDEAGFRIYACVDAYDAATGEWVGSASSWNDGNYVIRRLHTGQYKVLILRL